MKTTDEQLIRQMRAELDELTGALERMRAERLAGGRQ